MHICLTNQQLINLTFSQAFCDLKYLHIYATTKAVKLTTKIFVI